MVGVIQKSSLDLKGPLPLCTKAVDRSILLRIGSKVRIKGPKEEGLVRESKPVSLSSG